MTSTYMDFAKEIEILEYKSQLLKEITLDESVIIDKIKNWSGDKIKAFVDKNYKKFEEKEKEVKSILIKNKVDIKLIQSEIKSLEPQIKKDIKNIDSESGFKAIIKKIWDKLNSIELFGKEGDPAKLIPAIATFVFISLLKVAAICIVGSMFGETLVPIQLILVFLGLPVISEIGKFISIKMGSYEKVHVYLNITEFITMTGLYLFLTNVGLLPLLIMRVLQFATGLGTGVLIKKYDEQGAGWAGAGLASFIQLVRVLIEICFVSYWTGNPFNTADFWKK